MKKISPAIHGVLDYCTVLFLLISPSVFNMHHTGSVFTYVLACIHLILTLFTNFKAGVFKIVPLKIHGVIELLVSATLVVVAIWFRDSGNTVSFYYYVIFSALLFLVWILTDYRRPCRE